MKKPFFRQIDKCNVVKLDLQFIYRKNSEYKIKGLSHQMVNRLQLHFTCCKNATCKVTVMSLLSYLRLYQSVVEEALNFIHSSSF